MENLEAFCSAWLNSWTGNQPDKLLGFYTEDALYLDPANKQGLKGHKELLPYFSKLLRFNTDWRWKAMEIISTGKGFTLKWEASIPVGTTTLIEHGLDIVEMQDGKISRNEVYFDRTAWMKALAESKNSHL